MKILRKSQIICEARKMRQAVNYEHRKALWRAEIFHDRQGLNRHFNIILQPHLNVLAR